MLSKFNVVVCNGGGVTHLLCKYIFNTYTGHGWESYGVFGMCFILIFLFISINFSVKLIKKMFSNSPVLRLHTSLWPPKGCETMRKRTDGSAGLCVSRHNLIRFCGDGWERRSLSITGAQKRPKRLPTYVGRMWRRKEQLAKGGWLAFVYVI